MQMNDVARDVQVDSALPVRHAEKQAPAQYIRYTPSQQAGNFNSGAQQRIIRMVEAQVDPMEPPKFKYAVFFYIAGFVEIGIGI